MSKKLFISSMMLLALLGQTAVAGPWDNFPGRPGQGPGRPGDDRPGPGRPGQGPGRPGDDRPGPGRPGDDRPGPGRPGQGPSRPPVGRIEYVTLQTFRVEKLVEKTTTIRVNMPDVKTIQLAAKHNGVDIIEARAQLDNGREIYMDGITGGLREGRSFIYTLDGRGERIRSITVRAITRGLIGSRADLEVSVGVFRY